MAFLPAAHGLLAREFRNARLGVTQFSQRVTLGWMVVLRLFVIAALVACGSGGGFPDARVVDTVVPGTFSLDWIVTDAADRSIACDTIGANSVTVLAHNRAFSGGETQVFSCRTGTGVSQALAPGTYDFEFQLIGQSDVIATAPAQRGVEVVAGDNVRLAPLTFKVTATGALSLTLLTGRSAGNCSSPPGGGGITSTQITLQRAATGACEPQLLAISASAVSGAPATTYQVDCAAPIAGPCIERDQIVTASSVPSGGYTIHIVATQGASVCWNNDDTIQVPPSGQTLSRGLNLAFATMTAGCM